MYAVKWDMTVWNKQRQYQKNLFTRSGIFSTSHYRRALSGMWLWIIYGQSRIYLFTSFEIGSLKVSRNLRVEIGIRSLVWAIVDFHQRIVERRYVRRIVVDNCRRKIVQFHDVITPFRLRSRIFDLHRRRSTPRSVSVWRNRTVILGKR